MQLGLQGLGLHFVPGTPAAILLRGMWGSPSHTIESLVESQIDWFSGPAAFVPQTVSPKETVEVCLTLAAAHVSSDSGPRLPDVGAGSSIQPAFMHSVE